jgi:hypothetical protein
MYCIHHLLDRGALEQHQQAMAVALCVASAASGKSVGTETDRQGYSLVATGLLKTLCSVPCKERKTLKSNNIIHNSQSALPMWYVLNTLILQIPSVKEEISHYSSHYSARLTAHPNDILLTLLEQPERKRLRRHLPNDLPTRFMV